MVSLAKWGLVGFLLAVSSPVPVFAQGPNPSDFIRPGILGSMAAAVGQFRAVQGPDGRTYIEGMQGLVRQEVRQAQDGSWEQVGSLDTVLPCAQFIHNQVTRKRTQ